uniref:Uncharacterized protein n=1 Tax=Cannabis sativa TaxID=3483 RepID=A0A803R153_CANSA
MKESHSIRVTPPSSVDFLTSPPNSSALFLISPPSFETINVLTALLIMDELTTSSLCSHSKTATPTLSTCVINRAFKG